MENNQEQQIFAYPSSYAQKRIWFLSSLESEKLSYNIGAVVVMSEEVDIKIMQKVFDKLIEKHEVLRTNFFISAEGEPVQMVRTEQKNTIVFYDLSKSRNKEKEKIEIIKYNSDYFFDLQNDSLIRVCLIKLAPQKYEFLVVMHHIISDMWSLGIFVNDFSYLYRQARNENYDFSFSLAPISTQYKDYATWQQSEDFNKKLKQDGKYWQEKLRGNLPILSLPTDRPRPLKQTYETNEVNLKIGKELTAKLNQVAKKYNITNYVLLLSVFKILLYKLSGQEDIIVGTYAANRDLPELDGLMGVFLNNLALRSQIDSKTSLEKFYSQVKETVLEAMEHKEYPFEKLIEDLNTTRDTSRAPIFNVLFQIFSDDDRLKMNFYGGKNKGYVFDNGMSQFDLTCKIVASEDRLLLALDYNKFLFRKDTAKKILNLYEKFLEKALDDSREKIADIAILEGEEKNKIINWSTGDKINYQDKDLLDLFFKSVSANSSNIAIKISAKKLSYKELNIKVNKMAQFLLSSGVQAGSIVALFLERDEWSIISILAILKIGAVYLPIDFKQPTQRIKYILEDSQTDFILYNKDLKFDYKFPKIFLSSSEVEKQLEDKSIRKHSSTALAYLMYTSGSTGMSKGVKIVRGALTNFILAFDKLINFKDRRILASTSIVFDISFLELILPLCLGGEVFLLKEKERLDITVIKKKIKKEKISLVQFTPSFLSLLLSDNRDTEWLISVDRFLIGGEKLDEELLRKLKKNFFGSIYNLYGPTETTIWSSIADLSREDKVSIGKPIANNEIFILDKDKNICLPKVPGEIYIAGAGLADSYTSEEETEKRFIEHPFSRGEKIYRTGDLAFWTENGDIQYIERIDEQVKINGRRIELGEISDYFKKLFSVDDCICLLGSDNLLYLYYTAVNELSADFLYSKLASVLPTYMLPSFFVFVEKFPLNANGKIDRASLLQLEPPKEYLKGGEITGVWEERVAEAWRLTLGVDKIGREDDFFHQGGNSLKLIQVYNYLQKNYPNHVSIAELFAYPTVATLANFLSQKQKKSKNKKINYKKRASNLIDKVVEGEISLDKAVEIFKKL